MQCANLCCRQRPSSQACRLAASCIEAHKCWQDSGQCAAPLLQTEAIKSGVQPGLTMVVGPPGTGKTDTAVQIMHVLYHNCPGQRTLLIAHSNQALNDLFEKILQRDVPARWVWHVLSTRLCLCLCLMLWHSQRV